MLLWGWDGDTASTGIDLRKLLLRDLGRWDRQQPALRPATIVLGDDSVIQPTTYALDGATIVELLAERYPPKSWSPSLRWFHAAVGVAVLATATGRVVPSLHTAGLRWRAGWHLLDDPGLDPALRRLDATMPPVVQAVRTNAGPVRVLAGAVVQAFADAVARDALAQEGWRPPLDRSRSTSVVALRRVCVGLTTDPIVVGDNDRHEATFATLGAALSEVRSRAEGAAPIACQGRLVPPPPAAQDEGDPGDGEATADQDDPEWTVEFEVVSLDDPSLSATWQDVWDAEPIAHKVVDGGSLTPVRRRLSDLSQRLASRIPGFEALTDTPEPARLSLSISDVGVLLTEHLDLCRAVGVPILVPTELVKRQPRLTAKASESTGTEGGVSGNLGAALVEVDWNLALGDDPLTETELAELAAAKAGLVQIRGEWIQVDEAQVKHALDTLSRRRSRSSVLTAGELLRTAAEVMTDPESNAGDALFTDDDASSSGWLAGLLAGLPDDELTEAVEPPNFVGELRHYQRRALGWMEFLGRIGLGGCLADDMGLGKTPTTLAHLAGRAGPRPHLVICPLSVVHNWESEAARFTPDMRVMIAHGSDRPRGEDFVDAVANHDIVVTTYGTAARDVGDLAAVGWEVVVCDEAQAIKNHRTHAARAVRKLQAQQKIALTGTPIENRLTELWAILDAVNPSMLGGVTWFRERFATPIETHNSDDALAALQQLTGPFILRRTKANRSLVPDLPDKVEQVCWATLTREQASLYKAVVDDFLADADKGEAAEPGMARRGLVLATLTRLKQICNHPAQFLADGSRLANRSGKLARFDELVDDLLAAGERALVFTQYREMGLLLATHLEQRLEMQAPFLHGGVPKRRRDAMVTAFQAGEGPPLQLISVKAGGTGLNLTAASRVIHYDRWWNPAVEDQATDRAWRIGQEHTVFVHKLVCQGTLEERIDALLRDKKALADSVVGSGEGFLTELSTDELRSLLVLDPTSTRGAED